MLGKRGVTFWATKKVLKCVVQTSLAQANF